MRLRNTTGPALQMDPLPADFNGDLGVGQLATTPYGPVVGVHLTGQATPGETTYLATGIDLEALAAATPVTTAIPPVRVLDTRTAAGRTRIAGSSASPFDATGRLRAAAWIDLAIDATDNGFLLDAAFLNVTVSSPTKNGSMCVYAPRPRPAPPPSATARDRASPMAPSPRWAWSVATTPSGSTPHNRVYVFVDLTGAVVRADLGQTQLAAPQRVAAAVGRIRTKIAKLGSR